MKKILFSALFFLLAVFPAMSKETLFIVADEWCPYNCAPDSEKSGYVVEITKEIFAKHNIDVKYEIVPWARALEGTSNGTYGAAICAAKSEGPDFIFPTEIVGMSQNKFFVKKDSKWNYANESSLKEVTVGVIADYSYGEMFDNYIKQNQSDNTKIQVTAADNAGELNIKKLASGRVSAIYGDASVTKYLINKLGFGEELREAGTTNTQISPNEGYYYLGLSPKNANSAKYAKFFSDGIEEMRKSGRLKEILDKYGLQDWKK